MPPSVRFASRDRADDGLEVGAGQDVGQRIDERAEEPPGAAGRAKSSTRALLLRDFSG